MSHPWLVLQPIPVGEPWDPALLAHPTRSGLGGSPAGPSNTLQSTRRNCQIPRLSCHILSLSSASCFLPASHLLYPATQPHPRPTSALGDTARVCSTAGVPAFGAGVAGQGPRLLLLICLRRAGQKKGCQNSRNNKNTHRQSQAGIFCFRATTESGGEVKINKLWLLILSASN